MNLPRFSLTVWILIGFLLGILTGLLFGDLCSVMKPLSEAFIKIWQITILPSVALSLIVGIGSLKRDTAKAIAVKAILVILMIWVIGTIGYFSFQLAFPTHEVASFFSTQELAQKTGISLIDEFIPANPFSSLSEGIIPATVLFCLFLGFALMLDDGSGSIVGILKVLLRALDNMTRIIAKTFPAGVFVITAVMAGTITIERFLELEVFLITLGVAAVLLGLVVLPLIVTCFTPFTWREILSAASRPMVLAFSTGTEFITLPQISEGVESLFAGRAGTPDPDLPQPESATSNEPGHEEVRSYSEVLVPIAYTFPLLGGLVPFLFILFVAWMYNSPLDVLQQLELVAVGIPSFFGSSKLSVLSLLDLMHLPADAYNLYLSSGILRQAFVAPLSVISIFSFSVVTIALTTGRAEFRAKRAVMLVLLFGAAGVFVIAGLNLGFGQMLAGTYHGGDYISKINLPSDPAGNRLDAVVNTTVYLRPEDVPSAPPTAAGTDKLREIRERGSLRVGYNSNNVPFVFFNGKGELVGYDVEMAYDLARFLNVSKIEFVPIRGTTMGSSLSGDYCDIVMAAVMVSENRLETMKFSEPVVAVHLGFVVPDGRKDEFANLEDVRKMKGVRIAAFNNTAAVDMARRLFRDAVIVPIEKKEDFFETKAADALFIPAEEGYTLTLLYPFYDVAILQPYDTYQILYAYPVALDSSESFRLAINYWITTEKSYGMLEKKYDYWVLGNIPEVTGPRWSVVRNVLHWVN